MKPFIRHQRTCPASYTNARCLQRQNCALAREEMARTSLTPNHRATCPGIGEMIVPLPRPRSRRDYAGCPRLGRLQPTGCRASPRSRHRPIEHPSLLPARHCNYATTSGTCAARRIGAGAQVSAVVRLSDTRLGGPVTPRPPRGQPYRPTWAPGASCPAASWPALAGLHRRRPALRAPSADVAGQVVAAVLTVAARIPAVTPEQDRGGDRSE
jgi:hypothetical protein